MTDFSMRSGNGGAGGASPLSRRGSNYFHEDGRDRSKAVFGLSGCFPIWLAAYSTARQPSVAGHFRMGMAAGEGDAAWVEAWP
jgi:hypothetical protein